MSVYGMRKMSPIELAKKLSYGNAVAKSLLIRLSQKNAYGEKFLYIIDKTGLLGPRIEHLYNALHRDETMFVRYVYLIAVNCSRDKIISTRYLDEFLTLVKELQPKYDAFFEENNW